MHYLQQPVTHRHHAQPAHQPTQSLHHGASASFANSSSGASALLGQHLRTAAAHRSNAAVGVGTFPTGSVAHATTDAFQPALCEHFSALIRSHTVSNLRSSYVVSTDLVLFEPSAHLLTCCSFNTSGCGVIYILICI